MTSIPGLQCIQGTCPESLKPRTIFEPPFALPGQCDVAVPLLQDFSGLQDVAGIQQHGLNTGHWFAHFLKTGCEINKNHGKINTHRRQSKYLGTDSNRT